MTTETAVRERPILFSGEMVRAILDGRKSQTRRVVKHQPVQIGTGYRWREPSPHGFTEKEWDALGDEIDQKWLTESCPYGQPGDRLWVREGFSTFTGIGRPGVLYRADPMYAGCKAGDFGWDWSPSIHMPRWASRLLLEITEVRVQRVQEISEDDVKAEGCTYLAYRCPDELPPTDMNEFSDLWDSLNTKRGFPWESNPWVWAISFRRVA